LQALFNARLHHLTAGNILVNNKAAAGFEALVGRADAFIGGRFSGDPLAPFWVTAEKNFDI
jgi:hypothetical protein